ncbi:hypothetical protein CEXT_554521 [Caerostris extrusa]|uniref:Uncharacterized protein n=1 Tax=Caerostris extrusa TaxID=172846 RepID=A0AAV4NG43_CAEEX|nr:hypothetical protein CEXT_554521 [Caerostris extrusa]
MQGSTSTVDVALLAEAHGLVTDMLADPHLPAHVVGGLRSPGLAALPSVAGGRQPQDPAPRGRQRLPRRLQLRIRQRGDTLHGREALRSHEGKLDHLIFLY